MSGGGGEGGGSGSATCTDQEFIQYNADGPFTATGNLTTSATSGQTFSSNDLNTVSGTWQLQGDQFTVTATQPAGANLQPVTATARVSGSKLTLIGTQNSITATSTLIRQ